MYAIISSSPSNSSSSTPDGTGEGEDSDWRLDDADAVLNRPGDDELPPCDLDGVDDDSFGLSSLSDFEGDSTESRLLRDEGSGCAGGGIAIDPVDDLRKPVNPIESRVDLRGSAVLDTELGTVRGTRDAD
jgi:hypothetical protein